MFSSVLSAGEVTAGDHDNESQIREDIIWEMTSENALRLIQGFSDILEHITKGIEGKS